MELMYNIFLVVYLKSLVPLIAIYAESIFVYHVFIIGQDEVYFAHH